MSKNILLRLANFLSLISYKIVSSKSTVGQSNSATETFSAPSKFGIVIVTYEARQFTRALPLIKQIRKSGISEPIALVFNGNFDAGFDPELRKEFLFQISNISDIFPIFLRKFHGLAHNWNLGIRILGCESTLVLNDDLWLDLGKFKVELLKVFEKNAASSLITINRSFSHFFISSTALRDVGWFDERFLGIGEEDGDYFLRYQNFYAAPPVNEVMTSIVHFNDFDSGSELKGVTKYSLANLEFSKLKYSNPADGDPGVFGERRLPKFPPAYSLPSEDFRRAIGDWQELDAGSFVGKVSTLLHQEIEITDN